MRTLNRTYVAAFFGYAGLLPLSAFVSPRFEQNGALQYAIMLWRPLLVSLCTIVEKLRECPVRLSDQGSGGRLRNAASCENMPTRPKIQHLGTLALFRHPPVAHPCDELQGDEGFLSMSKVL